MTEFVTPTIRTVLKTYQDSAIKSLQGPGLSLVHQHNCDNDSSDLNEPPPPPPAPEMPQPILSAPDPEHGSLQETTLEGKRIGCYLLGGEMRLCFPQILNNILTDFKLDQIYRVFDDLRIFCSQCTPEQLIEFKSAKILPDDTKASGLITRTNAERLCSALLHRSDNNARPSKNSLSFRVYHRCFGKCEGICTPEMYSFKEPSCIECVECRGMFSPQKFVCHVHRQQENQTCHWGFDSSNWRSYLHVVLNEKNREDFTKILDSLKERETQEAAIYLLNQRDMCHLKRKATIDDPNNMMPLLKSEPMDNIPLKKTKVVMDDAYHYLHYQKALLFAQYQQQSYAFNRPWAPLMPKQLQHLQFAASSGQQLSYLSQEPPILQNPERVVRSTECERFERSFQPNVALAPKKSQIANNNTHNNNNSSSKDKDSVQREREREKERQKDKDMHEQTVIKTEIKQERVSSPSDISNSPSEYCRSSPPEPQPSPRPPSTNTQQSRLHQHQNSIPPSSHPQQPPPHRPSVSPEGQSGSNEITSSTSPVPVINNNISNCINKAQVELLLINNLSPQPPPRRTPIPTENIHHRTSQPSPISLKHGMVNPEFELSTDTDDDSLQGEADSSNHTATLDMAVDVLKDVRPDSREKVLNLIKILVHENTQLKHVNIKNECLIQELHLRDERILDLEREQEKLKAMVHQLQLQQQQLQHNRHLIKMASVEPIIVPACRPTETIEKVVVERRNGFQEKPDVIMKPLKKSHRRTPDDSVVVMKQTSIIHPEHDNLKENHVIKIVESA